VNLSHGNAEPIIPSASVVVISVVRTLSFDKRMVYIVMSDTTRFLFSKLKIKWETENT
jgi:hypothetical protein